MNLHEAITAVKAAIEVSGWNLSAVSRESGLSGFWMESETKFGVGHVGVGPWRDVDHVGIFVDGSINPAAIMYSEGGYIAAVIVI